MNTNKDMRSRSFWHRQAIPRTRALRKDEQWPLPVNPIRVSPCSFAVSHCLSDSETALPEGGFVRVQRTGLRRIIGPGWISFCYMPATPQRPPKIWPIMKTRNAPVKNMATDEAAEQL